jgi:hypothetical protein
MKDSMAMIEKVMALLRDVNQLTTEYLLTKLGTIMDRFNFRFAVLICQFVVPEGNENTKEPQPIGRGLD